ncbi:MAG: acylphosphatase [Proteobacteria bacterium]|nr:acylphosphatase [Pseudomonadota bacterium]MCL2308541.1 acylphosphatase [Pseudomonadota bacterium]
MIARHLIIAGRVQGVFFRGSLVAEARQRPLVGWVRNHVRDGTVEAFIQGEEEEVEALVQWCRRGPPPADVTGLTVTDVDPDLALQIFEKRGSV